MENGEIAATLCIAERTVKLHVSALLDRFGRQNRVQLALIAGQAGLRVSQSAAERAETAA
jgi:DNA-binding NarL/FixJ family response regulator